MLSRCVEMSITDSDIQILKLLISKLMKPWSNLGIHLLPILVTQHPIPPSQLFHRPQPLLGSHFGISWETTGNRSRIQLTRVEYPLVQGPVAPTLLTHVAVPEVTKPIDSANPIKQPKTTTLPNISKNIFALLSIPIKKDKTRIMKIWSGSSYCSGYWLWSSKL